MPSRSPPYSVFYRTHTFHLRSRFHTSTVRPIEAKEGTHYDTLNLSPHSTRAEIKKRYFELSKTHHPDHNRNDPQASKRFVKISTAYAILGHEKHRVKYDRDLARRHGKAQHTGPVGGRPASGLSRRRSQFHGPPPSFSRSGGWSTFNGKPTHTGQGRHAPSSGVEGRGTGMGGSASGWADDVPHFNYGQKYRQHHEQQSRWAYRARQRRFEPDTGIIFPLIGVTTILIGVVSIAAYTSS